MEEIGIDVAAIDLAIANVFASKVEDTFEEDVTKWKQLVGMRAQMKEDGIGTEGIERFLANVFEVLHDKVLVQGASLY